MKYCMVLVLGVCLISLGCGKRANEKFAEKMIESRMARDGIKGHVDLSGNNVTVETKDGKMSYAGGAGTQVPDTFPKDVPVYAGATVMASISVPKGQNLTLTTKDSVEQVIAAYKIKMTSEGWQEEASVNQAGSAMLAYKKGQRTTAVVVSRSGDTTQINLTAALGD